MKLIGELIDLKLVRIEDSEYILNLRCNEKLNKYLSLTSIDLENQKNWLKKYLIREKEKVEIYFIVIDKNNKPCGTVRIYNINYNKKECTWGSFILSENRPNGSSYEVIELSLNYIYKKLNIERIFLNVNKNNKKAIYIYEKVGFVKWKEEENELFYVKTKVIGGD